VELQRLAVVGAGTMGHGIAQVAAQAGLHVVLVDVDAAALDRAMAQIRANLDGGVERGKVTAGERDEALQRIRTATELSGVVTDADLVVEAVPERLDLKQSVFQQLDAAAPAAAVLATNTSSLSITTLQRATARPARVVGLHFFNPVHIMKLVEVVRGQETAEAVVEAGAAFARRLGKEPIIVNDVPGFASSRLGIALGLEAIRMVEQGVAAPEAIDRAMELGYRHPMGPLRLTDLVGLDVRLAIAEYLHRELGSETFRPPELLRRMVAEGKLGKKSGQGFYTWTE
jgi:3-hydroxybutyryl-CoA dehydrogenase